MSVQRVELDPDAIVREAASLTPAIRKQPGQEID